MGGRPIEVTAESLCTRCLEPFGVGAMRPRRGRGVGIDGLIHVRCYDSLGKSLRRTTGPPLAVYHAPRAARPRPEAKSKAKAKAKAKAHAKTTARPLAIDAVARIEASDAGEASRAILWATRKVFAGRGGRRG